MLQDRFGGLFSVLNKRDVANLREWAHYQRQFIGLFGWKEDFRLGSLTRFGEELSDVDLDELAEALVIDAMIFNLRYKGDRLGYAGYWGPKHVAWSYGKDADHHYTKEEFQSRGWKGSPPYDDPNIHDDVESDHTLLDEAYHLTYEIPHYSRPGYYTPLDDGLYNPKGGGLRAEDRPKQADLDKVINEHVLYGRRMSIGMMKIVAKIEKFKGLPKGHYFSTYGDMKTTEYHDIEDLRSSGRAFDLDDIWDRRYTGSKDRPLIG